MAIGLSFNSAVVEEAAKGSADVKDLSIHGFVVADAFETRFRER